MQVTNIIEGITNSEFPIVPQDLRMALENSNQRKFHSDDPANELCDRLADEGLVELASSTPGFRCDGEQWALTPLGQSVLDHLRTR